MIKKDLTRESLAEQVANALRDYIFNSLEPYDYLPSTAQLAGEFQVSRIVIREALKFLEAQDIIEITNGKRARVKPISADILRSFFRRATSMDESTFMELLEVRRGIEIESAGLAALRRTPAQLAGLETLIEAMKPHLDDPEAFADLDVELHQQIAWATHNSMLIFLVETIRDVQRETILRGLHARFTPKEFLEIHDLHARIVAAIAVRDEHAARRAMVAHFTNAETAVGYTKSGWAERGDETS